MKLLETVHWTHLWFTSQVSTLIQQNLLSNLSRYFRACYPNTRLRVFLFCFLSFFVVVFFLWSTCLENLSYFTTHSSHALVAWLIQCWKVLELCLSEVVQTVFLWSDIWNVSYIELHMWNHVSYYYCEDHSSLKLCFTTYSSRVSLGEFSFSEHCYSHFQWRSNFTFL